MCNTRVLYQSSETTVSQCVDCGMFFVWHQNLLLHFNNDEFGLFVNHIKKYNFFERAIAFPDGEERIMIPSPTAELSLVFEREEWETFKETLMEAAYLGEIYALLKGKRE